MVARDIRQVLRSLARTPLFAGVVVLLLALGIGANALIFTAVDVLLLRPLPVPHPEQMVRLGVQRSPVFTSYQHSYAYALVLRARSHAFSDVIASWPVEMALRWGTRVESITGNTVSGNYFSALGLTPAVGRLFTAADEERCAPVAVLSYGFWKRAFARREDVIGKTIDLRGSPFTVIGVMQSGFVDLDLENRPDVWVPISAWTLWSGQADTSHVPAQVYMRLRGGVPHSVTLAQAEAEVRALFPEMVTADFAASPGVTAGGMEHEKAMQPVLTSAERGVSTLRKQFTGAATAVMGGVVALLLLVCGNIGGLMLARAETQGREVAIRLSLGASRWSILRRTLVESVLLSCAGAMGGLLIARWCGPWLLRFLPARRPLAIELTPDLRVVAFAALIGVFSTVAMSILPAIGAFRAELSGTLERQSGRASRPRLSRGLVAFQVALATLVMTGSLALVRTLDALRAQDPGFRRENLIVMTLNPRMAGVKSDSIPAVLDEVVRRTRSLPGVEAVSLAQRALMRGVGFKGTAGRAGSRITFADLLNVSLNGVSLDHFANLRMRIVRGRGFEPADNRGTPRPVIVSESFARQFFPGMDPIGQTFGMGGIGSVIKADKRIVGVVNDTKYRSMRETPPPTIYSLLDDDGFRYEGMVLHVGARGTPSSTIAALTGMLRGVGPGLAPSDVATMEQEIDTSLWQERLLASLSSIFALLSTALAGLGLFGMLAYAVSRRTREIGIRVAVGATVGRIAWMIGRDAAMAVAPGLVLGLAAYAACSRVVVALLYGAGRWDALSIVGATGCLIAVSVCATLFPAMRATGIQPSQALREE
jgi:putative ABC transport system permease protein